MIKRKNFVSALLASALACALSFTSFAFAAPRFTDVNGHWAAAEINRIADGGLVQGYGNGKFGPDDILNIDQLAKIICNVKGVDDQAANGYWGYGAVKYCVETSKCLPSQGDYTAANYAVPCSRELAIYMFVKALGMGAEAEAIARPALTYEAIPDWADISLQYRTSALNAYKVGLIKGIDDQGTFGPDGAFTRAQVATMLVRAGWLKAAVKATDSNVETLTNQQIFEMYKATGILKYSESTGIPTLYSDGTPTMDEIGRVEINHFNGTENGGLVVTLREGNYYVDSTSSFNYAGRQWLKQVLQVAYPASWQEAYNAVHDVFLNEIHEYNGTAEPSALRWLDGREFRCVMDSSGNACVISIGQPGHTKSYNNSLAVVRSKRPSNYSGFEGTLTIDSLFQQYELDKW